MEKKTEREMGKNRSEETVELEKRGGVAEEELEEKEVNEKKEMEGPVTSGQVALGFEGLPVSEGFRKGLGERNRSRTWWLVPGCAGFLEAQSQIPHISEISWVW